MVIRALSRVLIGTVFAQFPGRMEEGVVHEGATKDSCLKKR